MIVRFSASSLVRPVQTRPGVQRGTPGHASGGSSIDTAITRLLGRDDWVTQAGADRMRALGVRLINQRINVLNQAFKSEDWLAGPYAGQLIAMPGNQLVQQFQDLRSTFRHIKQVEHQPCAAALIATAKVVWSKRIDVFDNMFGSHDWWNTSIAAALVSLNDAERNQREQDLDTLFQSTPASRHWRTYREAPWLMLLSKDQRETLANELSTWFGNRNWLTGGDAPWLMGQPKGKGLLQERRKMLTGLFGNENWLKLPMAPRLIHIYREDQAQRIAQAGTTMFGSDAWLKTEAAPWIAAYTDRERNQLVSALNEHFNDGSWTKNPEAPNWLAFPHRILTPEELAQAARA